MSIYVGLILFLVLLGAYYSHRYAWWKKAVPFKYPRILMYHMISNPIKGAKFNSLRVSPEMFEKQLRYLIDNDWQFFTMSELVSKKDQLPEKSIAITFDDGYQDNISNALPLLKKYKAKATIYLVIDRHNREWSSKRKKKNNSGELMAEPKLSDEQVKELLESGLIEIGSHTVTHDNLPTLSEKQKHEEIVCSKKKIEDLFGIKCHSFCYPFGLFDQADLDLVESAGYTNATTVETGISDFKKTNPYLLKRVTVSGKDNFYAFKLKMKIGRRGIKK
ncbi:polysaccharide deacetylase family protein [uncultured Cocleimonas sp.]|uniref:polysaccharide deacetylase family protein n=1 Tax=uncultured Cocleimonas sp. TaxID=1051587 RepID=UPI002602F969|nr:polysaccharide deacetylase family protein [uncultured Cocleimonas sp.]